MPTNRRDEARERRQDAATAAYHRPHPNHLNNGDEQKFRHDEDTATTHKNNNTDLANIEDKPSYMMSFTKGMPHDENTGLVSDPANFQQFVKAINSGDERDFIDTPLYDAEANGGKSDKANNGTNPVPVRGWESQSAGLAFTLDGPDPQAVTMPPAPRLGGAELTAEMAEVYVQALLRDVPFNAMSAGVTDNTKLTDLNTDAADVATVDDLTNKLNGLEWFNGTQLDLNDIEEERRRDFTLNPANAFRGITPGDEIGPYLSQFLIAGNRGINGNDNDRSPRNGLISYGGLTIIQQVRTAEPGLDYMTTWNEWLDVQNGADVRGLEQYRTFPTLGQGPYDRPILTPRDLATYVHYDALYQAYLNACLIMLGMGIPYDPGIPFQQPDAIDNQQGFAHFGGPHVLSLVTEVATRALKAVRFQKFNVHRRCRPEVLAARIYKANDLTEMSPELVAMKAVLDTTGIDLLQDVRDHNLVQNGTDATELLPMAFCEGSPMHPAYGAGHATVAGACVTILKAFFDHEHHLNIVPDSEITGSLASSYYGYVTTQMSGNTVVPVYDQQGNPAQLTVEGELNKLASNISIGRNWGGVHYFTDYYESILMGEQIALGILREQKLIYNENFSMTVPLFNGDNIHI